MFWNSICTGVWARPLCFYQQFVNLMKKCVLLTLSSIMLYVANYLQSTKLPAVFNITFGYHIWIVILNTFGIKLWQTPKLLTIVIEERFARPPPPPSGVRPLRMTFDLCDRLCWATTVDEHIRVCFRHLFDDFEVFDFLDDPRGVHVISYN